MMPTKWSFNAIQMYFHLIRFGLKTTTNLSVVSTMLFLSRCLPILIGMSGPLMERIQVIWYSPGPCNELWFDSRPFEVPTCCLIRLAPKSGLIPATPSRQPARQPACPTHFIVRPRRIHSSPKIVHCERIFLCEFSPFLQCSTLSELIMSVVRKVGCHGVKHSIILIWLFIFQNHT